jgi:hypothetical protein
MLDNFIHALVHLHLTKFCLIWYRNTDNTKYNTSAGITSFSPSYSVILWNLL